MTLRTLQISSRKSSEVSYDPDTGVFYRNGKPVGYDNGRGYLQVSILCKRVYLHRLAFDLMGQPLLEGEVVDHKNRDKKDNRWSNLRRCTQAQNLQNRDMKGYCWDRAKKKWMAYIGIGDSKTKFLGYFEEELLAKAAYLNRKQMIHTHTEGVTALRERCHDPTL